MALSIGAEEAGITSGAEEVGMTLSELGGTTTGLSDEL